MTVTDLTDLAGKQPANVAAPHRRAAVRGGPGLGAVVLLFAMAIGGAGLVGLLAYLTTAP